MILWLARHGEAVDPDKSGSDRNRQLTEFGRLQVSQLVRFLLERTKAPTLVLHSPILRARQTAEVIAGEIGRGITVLEEPLLEPGVHSPSLLRRLSDSGEPCVACVGHQPDMSRCLAEMIGGGQLIYSPGTIAGVDFTPHVAVGNGELRWLADPNWFH